MHAIVIHASTWPRQRGLDEQVLPMIKGAAGFLGAYLEAVDTSNGFSIQVFETEEQTRAAAPPKGAEAPGVTLDTLQFDEVIGSA
jgi:hypothetical protein